MYQKECAHVKRYGPSAAHQLLTLLRFAMDRVRVAGGAMFLQFQLRGLSFGLGHVFAGEVIRLLTFCTPQFDQIVLTHIHAITFSGSRRPESNRRPHPYHGCALPAELRRRYVSLFVSHISLNVKHTQGVHQNANK